MAIAPMKSSTTMHTIVITIMSIVLKGPSLVGRGDSIPVLELLLSNRGEEHLVLTQHTDVLVYLPITKLNIRYWIIIS